MLDINEYFVVRLTDDAGTRRARRIARRAFLALDGVRDWRTHRSVATDRPTLFVETFTFADEEVARAAGARFSQMDETRAFLAHIDETILGQHFIDVTEDQE